MVAGVGVARWLLRWSLWLALWFALTGDFGPSSWLVGLPTTLAAVLLMAPGAAPRRWSALAGLAAVFLAQSLRGGVDVARRAWSPRPRLDPVELRFAMRLPPGAPRVWLALLASLVPGSLSVRTDGELLLLHVLDRQLPVEQDLRRLEARIRALAGGRP